MYCESITHLIHAYGAATGLTSRTVSTYAAGSGDFCDRLERGHDLTTRRAAKVTQWLSDNWPADLAWPPDIPRPLPSADSPASRTGEAA